MIRATLSFIWQSYVALSKRFRWLAVPFLVTMRGVGRVKVHPRCWRLGFQRDPVIQCLATLVNPGDTVIDVGANFGLLSLIAATKCGPEGQVVAFEPAAANAQILEYHMRANRLTNVLFRKEAVGQHNGTVALTLLEGGESSGNSIAFSRKRDTPYVSELVSSVTSVPVTTLDTFCSEQDCRPDVLKIDVEGAELDVLMGAKEILRRHKPTILIGIHEFWWPDDQAPGAVTELLSSLGYRWKTVAGEEREEVRGYDDFVCLPPEH